MKATALFPRYPAPPKRRGALPSLLRERRLTIILASNNVLSEQDRKEKHKSLGIDGIHDLKNLITLCKCCHGEFEKNEICIHPSSHRWIVSATVRDRCTYSQQRFIEYHFTPVCFPKLVGEPSEALLQERMSRFCQVILKSITVICVRP